MTSKQIFIIGGGTFNHVRNHLSLAAPAFGNTARIVADIFAKNTNNKMEVNLVLTKMADPKSNIITNADLSSYIDGIISNLNTKIVFMNAALCDYNGVIDDVESGKYSQRLHTSDGNQVMFLEPADKVIGKIRQTRKDIFLIGSKTTTNANADEMYIAGLGLCKKASCNMVLVNDTVTRMNMIVTPEEARYHVSTNRKYVLEQMVEMALMRSSLTFTRSTVVAGNPIPWESEQVPNALRIVVDHCIKRGAYKPFNGSTAGHFACKVGEKTFLTSRRKQNFNELNKVGLVKIETDGEDSVIAYGSKPSVGGQSQRIIFADHPEYNCIVHAHVPIRKNSNVPVISQEEYECGSHECGKNTSNGLKKFLDGKIAAVMLNEHGPNVVFNSNIDPQLVIDFIEENFDLTDKTGGPVSLEKVKNEH